MPSADSADAAAAVTLLDAALSLWRGAAFAEHADVPRIAPPRRAAWTAAANGASEARAVALLHAGRFDESVAAAEALATARATPRRCAGRG